MVTYKDQIFVFGGHPNHSTIHKHIFTLNRKYWIQPLFSDITEAIEVLDIENNAWRSLNSVTPKPLGALAIHVGSSTAWVKKEINSNTRYFVHLVLREP